jgi:hypothetical protein
MKLYERMTGFRLIVLSLTYVWMMEQDSRKSIVIFFSCFYVFCCVAVLYEGFTLRKKEHYNDE